MDESKQFINMCEKAVEIQKLAPLRLGEWYAYLRPIKGSHYCHNNIIVDVIREDECGEPSHFYVDDIERCWLPDQAQLQEMLGEQSFCEDENGYIGVLALLDKFAEDAHGVVGFSSIYSMEQLWLAFVMEEKYNKSWNGKDWIEHRRAEARV